MAELDTEFTPHMPEVDARPNLSALFADARARVANPDPKVELVEGQRCIGVVTPGRMVMFVPAPKPGAVPAQFLEMAKRLLPSEKPLRICAIAFTELKPMMKDQLKCIPFLAQLLGLAYLGNNVIVFEGHPSAFEAPLPETDVLWIDSAMLPFLQADWARVAFRAMPEGRRIVVFSRKNGALMPVIPSKDERGWRFSEPDGEGSYANCLLTTLAKRSPISVQVAAGRPAPDLATLALDPKELEWVAELPFRYDHLDSSKVIELIRQFAKLGDAHSGTLKAKLATGAGNAENVAFALQLSADAQSLEIKKIAA